MTTMDKELLAQKLIASVENDDNFCKALVSAENAVAAQKVLKENGFDLSAEEIEVIFADGMKEVQKSLNSTGELSEEQLEDVSGGGFFKGTVRLVASCGVAFGYGCFCGICPAASAGAPYLAGGLAAWTTAGYMKK